ncbi:MAG: hypothetical protein WCP30_03045, partial [Mycobacteriaceae bacterium]
SGTSLFGHYFLTSTVAPTSLVRHCIPPGLPVPLSDSNQPCAVYVHSQANALQAAAASFDRVVTTRDTETGSGG